MDSKNTAVDFRQLLYILKKHLRLIMAVTFICGLSGLLITKILIVPQYEANATLVVNPGQNTQNTTITYDQLTVAQQLVGTYSIILKSDTVLDQVIENLNLGISSQQLAGKITVSGVNQTEVIQISVRDRNPRMAQKIEENIIKVAPAVIIRTLKAGSVEIISPAKAESRPVSPNTLLNTLIALLAGAAVSLSAAFIMELLNNTFSSDEDIQKHLGLTVLGVIPNYETGRGGR